MISVTRGSTVPTTTTTGASQSQVDSIQTQANTTSSTVTTLQGQLSTLSGQLTTLSGQIPVAATATPPAVADASATGTAVMFARSDHTHWSSVQSALLTISGGSGQVTWTFPKPFPSGVSPIVVATVQSTSGATQPFVINLMGTPSNTAVTIGVFRSTTVTLPGIATSLLNFVVNGFGLAPNGTVVHIIARAPNQ